MEFNADLNISGDLELNASKAVIAKTSDAADTSILDFFGGGDNDKIRGGGIRVAGNESTEYGRVYLQCGQGNGTDTCGYANILNGAGSSIAQFGSGESTTDISTYLKGGVNVGTTTLTAVTAGQIKTPYLQITGYGINNYVDNALGTFYLNYGGYDGGTTQFRDLYIGDGKNHRVALFAGTDKSLTVEGGLNVGTATGAAAGQIKAKTIYISDTTAATYGALSIAGTSRGGKIDLYDGVTLGASIYGGTATDKSLKFTTNGSNVRQTIAEDGTVTIAQGLNVGTVTGATAGQIVASSGFFNGTSGYGYNCTANPGQANSRSWRLMNDDSVYGDLYLKKSSTNNNTINTNVAFWDKDGNFTQVAGLNVGTATGATTGQIKTSGLIDVNTSGYLGQINATRAINSVDGSVGSLSLSGLNATGSQVMYGAITAMIRSTTVGAESGGLSFRTLNSGALVDGINITPSGGLNIGTATGATTGQIKASGVYGNDVGAVRQVYVNSDGLLGYNSSALRFKENVIDLGVTSELLYQLRPVTYNRKSDTKEIKDIHYGLIAEEVDLVDKSLVYYSEDENNNVQIDGVAYDKLIPLLLNEIQKLNARIGALENA